MNLDRLKREREQMIRDFTRHPSCIIIHTGTNDLHSLCNSSSDAVRKMAEITSKMFPESRIIISTHLPRHDTPPHHLIYSINAVISHGCSVLPNVHLAHHHNIGLQHLLHLLKDGVCILAKTLKDAALQFSITETPVTNSTIPLAYSPLHAQTSPSGPRWGQTSSGQTPHVIHHTHQRLPTHL